MLFKDYYKRTFKNKKRVKEFMGLFDFLKPKKCPVCGMKKVKGTGSEVEGTWYCEMHVPGAPKPKGPVEY